MAITLEVLVILTLTLINGVLAMSELALVSARRVRLRQAARAGNHGALVALRLIADPGRFLSTVQIGITLVGILAGAFGGATLADHFGDWLDTWPWVDPNGHMIAIGFVVLGITCLSLIVGELVPKHIALGNPERMATLVAPTMDRLSRLAAPAVWLLGISTGAILRAVGVSERRNAVVTEDEIRLLIAEGTRAGIFVPRERDMIEGVMRLADRSVRVVMTPRPEVAWLDVHAGRETIAAVLQTARFSRFPVCEGAVDRPIGIVHAKDLLRVALGNRPIDLGSCTVPPIVVHERIPVLRLLDRFESERIHMAIVVDEFGVNQGVVTLTDILESIAGDLPERGETPGPTLVQQDDGSWLVDGSLPIDEFEDRLGLGGLSGAGDFDTVAGFVLQRLGHLPEAGESFVDDDARFEVIVMDERRIDKVSVRLPDRRIDDASKSGADPPSHQSIRGS